MPETIAVQEIVDMKLGRKGFGVEGYNIRNYDPYIDKPIVTKIPPGNKGCFLDELLKSKKHINVAQFDLSGSMLHKRQKSSADKAPRITIPDEIARMEKRFTKPGPGQYTVKEKKKLAGAFNLKDARDTFIEEAQFQSMQTPTAVYNGNYTTIMKKVPTAKIYADNKSQDSPTRIQKSDLPAVGSYDEVQAYKKTQLKKSSFVISKGKILGQNDKVAK